MRGAPEHIWPQEVTQEEEAINVLMVEDTRADALLTRISLKATGIPFELTEIKRGDEVLPMLSRMRLDQHISPSKMPDIIILDLGLPGLSGFDLLAELTQMPPSIRAIPILVLTAHQHFEYLRYAYPYLNMIGYLNKPCNMGDLKEVLRRVQSGKRKQREFLEKGDREVS